MIKGKLKSKCEILLIEILVFICSEACLLKSAQVALSPTPSNSLLHWYPRVPANQRNVGGGKKNCHKLTGVCVFEIEMLCIHAKA